MRREDIIAKGAYTAPQFGELISVKQFIMLRQRGAKCLLLRLHNDRAERANAVSFTVKQFDVKGNLLESETIVERNISVQGGEDFSPKSPIKMHRACVDFTVDMVWAEYGDYTYRLHNGKLSASYESRSDMPPLDKEGLSKRMRGKASRVQVRTLRAPVLLIISMTLILGIISAFSFMQLKNFMATEEFFTLENVEFRFETDNHENGPISIVGYKGKAGNIVIPASIEGHPVVGIADGAFESRMLRSVNIKGSVYIGERAFADCRLLSVVSIPHVTELGAGAFADCSNLKDLVIDDSLTAIPASTFAGCSSLTAIPQFAGLTALGDNAFNGCVGFTEITLPDTLTQMGEGVFANCTSVATLTSPYVGLNEQGKDNVGYLFGGSDQIPDSLRAIVITKATSIGDNAFNGCGKVESITIPTAVTSIGAEAFRGCASLTDIRLPSQLTFLGSGAFRDCTGLKEITLPAKLRTVSQAAFAGCYGIQSISLPLGLETIESYAFDNCTGLTRLDIPSSVTTLAANALGGCINLEELSIPFIGTSADAPCQLSELCGGVLSNLKGLTVRDAEIIPDGAFVGFNGLVTISVRGTASRIGERAFQDCAALKTVSTPESVTEMGVYAFEGCTGLESIQLPRQLSTICEGVFSGCTSLTDVDVPANVETIEDRAFAGCSSLKDATWLGGIQNMGEYVFESCTALETVALPSDMSVVQTGTFSGCTALHTITMSPATTVIGEQAFFGCTALETVTIPGLTEEIMKEAFAGCTALTTIDIPASVTILGESVFADCASIRGLAVPATVNEIGQNLIVRCDSLETLTIPYLGSTPESEDGLTYLADPLPDNLRNVHVTNAKTLADQAFADCTQISTITLANGLVSIGKFAFKNCFALTELTIPSSVTEIREKAFYGCSSLTEITIPDDVTSLKGGLFYECTALEKITVPFIGLSNSNGRALNFYFNSQSVPASVSEVTITNATALASEAFDGCSNLRKITLDCNLETIGQYAFRGCSSLEELTLPSTLTRIGDQAFEDCSGLEKLVIPTSVIHMGVHTFAGCSSLKELEIPFVGATYNDEYSLTHMFWNNVPSSLTKVTITNSNYAKSRGFQDCWMLTEIVYDCPITEIGEYAFSGCSNLTQFTVPDTVVSIGEYAFNGCSRLRSLTIPASVEYIGRCVFSDCSSLEELEIPFVGYNRDDSSGLRHMFNNWGGGVPSSLRKVTVTDSVYIQDNAFEGCSHISEIVYTGNVQWIGRNAFYNCYSLAHFSIPDTVTSIGEYTFAGCQALEEIALPDSLMSIGEYAFNNCSGLTSVTIPDSVTDIGRYAFAECYALQEMTVPFVGTSAYNDGQLSNWFYGVPESLKKVTVTNSTYIPNSAFSGCSYIEEIICTSDVQWIGSYAFSGCNALAQISLPDTVTGIGENAFRNCYALTEVTLPASLESIGYEAFYSCHALEEIALPDSLMSIGENAFNNCSGLTSVTIPDSVTDIGWYAFAGCYALQEMTVPFVGTSAYSEGRLSNWFYSVPESLKKVTVTNRTYIPGSTFSGCGNVEEIVYTQPVVSIGDYAFEYCYSLKTLNIGESFETIGYRSFSYCRSLKSFTLPESCYSIDGYAFNGTYALYEVYNRSGLSSSQLNNTGLLDYCLVYRTDDTPVQRASADGVEFLLADNGMWYVTDYTGTDTHLRFPAQVATEEEIITEYYIAPYAFSGRTDITSVTLPAAVTRICDGAFENCSNLREIYDFSPLVLVRGDYGNGQVALNALIIHNSEGNESLNTVYIGDFEFYKSDDNWFLVGYHGQGGEVVLDSFTYNGRRIPAYEVIRSAFQYNGSITSLTITDAVKSIAAYGFYNMGALERLYIEENRHLTHIPDYAFAYCYNLKQVTLPATLSGIGNYAFDGCQSLIEVYDLSPLDLTIGSYDHGSVALYALIIHDSLSDPPLTEVQIGDYQFLNSGNVWILSHYNGSDANIVLGSFSYNGRTVSAYSILTHAFAWNSSIEHVEIKDQVKSMSREAFYNCTNLKSVSFAENTSITTIPYNAFAECYNLDCVVLPASLTEIQSYAFGECRNLLEVYNLSDLSLSRGDYGNGQVAYYAEVIHTSLDEVGLNVVNVNDNGYTYKFRSVNDEWVMYARVQVYNHDWRCVLPELILDGAVTPYRITAVISDCSAIVIPASVTYMDFNNFYGSEIYYCGTADEFADLANGFDVGRFNVWYYADCVHEYGQWSYVDGYISTEYSYNSEIIRESTCSESGIIRYTCYRCNGYWDEELPPEENHDLDEDLVCRGCHKCFERLSLTDAWIVENDPMYPFTITEDGEIISTNHDDSSSATITLTATRNLIFTYQYYTSTEENYDWLCVYTTTGDEITYASGAWGGIYTSPVVEVAAGDSISIRYSKDGSVNNGEDYVKVLNFLYFTGEEVFVE